VVTSADGTVIGYRSTGSGPGLVVIHGALETSAGYQGFADALADKFTVHVIDRRGRGLSGPHGTAHNLGTEVEDVHAVVEATGAQRVFGVSSGAVVALQAALELPGITHVAAYEPPINAPECKREVITRYEQEIAEGRHVEAMTTILVGLEVGPLWLRMLPRRLVAAMMRKFAEDDAEDVVKLVPTVRHDFRIVEEGSVNREWFKAIPGAVLLIGGRKSPRYLKEALSALGDLLPHAEKVLMAGANHNSSTDSPELVVPALREFFSSDSARGRTP
jgi:pimeloyl-ACP methyl ester carboxylesterase